MLRQHVFLIGMPGSGKTLWARLLSQHYKTRWVDLDGSIEKESGLSISEIFSVEGEATFRKWEREQLHKAIAQAHKPVIVSCGGGTPCFFDNMEWMKQHGLVIYLEADYDTLIERLQKNYHRRPLLRDNLEAHTAKLLQERTAIYHQAHLILPAVQPHLLTFTQNIDSWKSSV